jgi:hypothetical protein
LSRHSLEQSCWHPRTSTAVRRNPQRLLSQEQSAFDEQDQAAASAGISWADMARQALRREVARLSKARRAP